MGTKEDLSVAYSPGVAEPCLSIQRNERYAYEYTAKGHLVGVITNGTAVLGLGNIGPLAGAQDKIKGVGLCKPTVGLWTHRVKWFCYLPPPHAAICILTVAAPVPVRLPPLPGKPVMEGKAVLFKKFADLDSFDLEARLSAAVGVRMHIRISTMTLRVVVAAHIVCMQRLPSL